MKRAIIILLVIFCGFCNIAVAAFETDKLKSKWDTCSLRATRSEQENFHNIFPVLVKLQTCDALFQMCNSGDLGKEECEFVSKTYCLPEKIRELEEKAKPIVETIEHQLKQCLIAK